MLNLKNITPKKKYGQNFLADEDAVKALLETADISPKDIVLEIGAGTGIITKELAKLAKSVTAVEIDKDIIQQLKKNVMPFHNVKIVNGDALKLPLPIPNHKKYKALGAIPYQITSPLLHKLITAENPPRTITFIVQYEVAEKICAKPPYATYLSNITSLYGNAKLVKEVKPSSFIPQPSVNSAIIHIEKRKNPPSAKVIKEWSKFLHTGFKHPRKMLKNVFEIESLLEAEINPNSRAQEVNLEEWKRLYESF